MTKLTAKLMARGVVFDVMPHERTYTSIDEARALGISADEVIKPILIATGDWYALAVIPASRRLDMKLVREAVGDRHARLATEDEILRVFPDYELGALPPLGSILDVPTYVDPEVLDHRNLVFEAGVQTQSIRVNTADLFGREAVAVAHLTEPSEVAPSPS